MNTTTEKKRFTTRDVMVIAAMMVLTFAVYGAVGALTLPFPFLYLYCSAGIQEFFCATFYLVVANRLNKHGILMVWSAVFGIISALGGYVFLLPYFLLVGVICELVMLGKDSYRKPLRNAIGWSCYGLGMIIGNTVPIWAAWESYVAKASTEGFSQEVFDMQLNIHLIVQFALIIVGVGVVGALLSYCSNLTTVKVLTKTTMASIYEGMDNLLETDLVIAEKLDFSYITQRLFQDANVITSFVLSNFLSIFLNGTLIVGVLYCFFVIDPLLCLIVVVVLMLNLSLGA